MHCWHELCSGTTTKARMHEWCKFNFPASQDLTKGNHFVLSQHQANKKEKVCNYECPLPPLNRTLFNTHSRTQTRLVPIEVKNCTSPRESSSDGFDGEGTRAYHGKAEDSASTFSKASIIMFAVWFLPEIATSRAELLSTKKTTDWASLENRGPLWHGHN